MICFKIIGIILAMLKHNLIITENKDNIII